jgi:hypothetical protein
METSLPQLEGVALISSSQQILHRGRGDLREWSAWEREREEQRNHSREHHLAHLLEVAVGGVAEILIGDLKEVENTSQAQRDAIFVQLLFCHESVVCVSRVIEERSLCRDGGQIGP